LLRADWFAAAGSFSAELIDDAEGCHLAAFVSCGNDLAEFRIDGGDAVDSADEHTILCPETGEHFHEGSEHGFRNGLLHDIAHAFQAAGDRELLGIATTRPVMGFFFATSAKTHLRVEQFFGIAFWIGFSINVLIFEVWIRATERRFVNR
jgi:hypothetical protein